MFEELLSPQIQGCLNPGFTVKFGLQINTECLMQNMGICIFIRRQLTVSRKKKDIWMWSFPYPSFKTQLDCPHLREAFTLLFLPFPSLSSLSPAPPSRMMAILAGTALWAPRSAAYQRVSLGKSPELSMPHSLHPQDGVSALMASSSQPWQRLRPITRMVPGTWWGLSVWMLKVKLQPAVLQV